MKNFIIAVLLIESSVFNFLSMNKEVLLHSEPFFKQAKSWGIPHECKKLPKYNICKD